MNIFGITGQYLELLQMAEDETLDQDMINDTLEGVDWEFEEKGQKIMNKVGLQDIVGGQLQEKFNRAFER